MIKRLALAAAFALGLSNSLEAKHEQFLKDPKKWEIACDERGIPTSYAFPLLKQGIDFKRVEIGYKFGFKQDEVLKFNDTKKPNALITFPICDQFSVFENNDSISFFKNIKKHYDVWFDIPQTKEDVCEAIKQLPDPRLIVLSGHGTKKGLSLNNYNFLKTNDSYLKKCFKNLENSVIFFNSCSSAELAERVAEVSGAKTYGAKEPFKNKHISIKSYYPFDIRIIKEGRDITYRN